MGEGFQGLTRYHTIGLIVPLLAAISPMLLNRFAIEGVPRPFFAVGAGALVAAVCFVAFKYVIPEDLPLSKAVLCGLLVAEPLCFHDSTDLPSMASITLWLYFYYVTVEKPSH